MLKKSEIPLQKVTLLLFEGDFDKLRQYNPNIGAGGTIRLLVRKYINQVEDASGHDNRVVQSGSI